VGINSPLLCILLFAALLVSDSRDQVEQKFVAIVIAQTEHRLRKLAFF
jgi:hypothetical protein